MSERDLSGIWFTGERERNISGAFALAVSDWTERTPTKRNFERLRSHALFDAPQQEQVITGQTAHCLLRHLSCLLSAVALRTLYYTHFKLFYFPNVIGLVQRIVRFILVPNRKPRTERFNTNTRIVTPLITSPVQINTWNHRCHLLITEIQILFGKLFPSEVVLMIPVKLNYHWRDFLLQMHFAV